MDQNEDALFEAEVEGQGAEDHGFASAGGQNDHLPADALVPCRLGQPQAHHLVVMEPRDDGRHLFAESRLHHGGRVRPQVLSRHPGKKCLRLGNGLRLDWHLHGPDYR